MCDKKNFILIILFSSLFNNFATDITAQRSMFSVASNVKDSFYVLQEADK